MVKQQKVDYSHNLESLILKIICVDFDEYDSPESFFHMLFEDTDKLHNHHMNQNHLNFMEKLIYQIFRAMRDNGNYMKFTSISHVMKMT